MGWRLVESTELLTAVRMDVAMAACSVDTSVAI